MTDCTPNRALQSPAPRGPSAAEARLPRTQAEIVQAAERLDLTVPDACMPGVVANLALLDAHAETLLAPAPEREQ